MDIPDYKAENRAFGLLCVLLYNVILYALLAPLVKEEIIKQKINN